MNDELSAFNASQRKPIIEEIADTCAKLRAENAWLKSKLAAICDQIIDENERTCEPEGATWALRYIAESTLKELVCR